MENGVSHNPQGLLWEELLKKNRRALHRRIWHGCLSLYSTRVFLNKGLKALSTRHLFFDVLSIFGTLLPCLSVPNASGPIKLSVTSPHLESSPWTPRVRATGSLSTHGTRESPQGYTHCIQTSWRDERR